jgi:hypothetical protein
MSAQLNNPAFMRNPPGCAPGWDRPYAAGPSAWQAYAKAHPGYTIYHGRAFHDAVAEAFGKPFAWADR